MTLIRTDLRYAERSARNVLDLTVPQSATKPPLIVYIHGGAFRMGDKADGYGVTERQALVDAQKRLADINQDIDGAMVDALGSTFEFIRAGGK